MSQTIQLTEAQKQLRYQKITANGRREAWTFIVESGWDKSAIQAKLVDKEESRAYAPCQTGSMAPGASPRIFIDAYIATLKEAIEIIEVQQVDAAPTTSPPKA